MMSISGLRYERHLLITGALARTQYEGSNGTDILLARSRVDLSDLHDIINIPGKRMERFHAAKLRDTILI